MDQKLEAQVTALRAENTTLLEALDRCRTEISKLRKNAERFRAVMKHAPFAIALKDTEGRYLEVNPAWQALHGWTRDEALGKNATQIFDAETAKVFTDHERKVLESRQAFDVIEKAPHPDGTEHEFLAVRFPVPDETGADTGFGLIAVDVTPRQKAEQAMRAGDLQLRAITDNLPVLITRLEAPDGRYLFVNRTAELWYARPAADIIGKTVTDIFNADLYEKIWPRVEAAMAGESVKFEERFTYPDGVTRDVELLFLPDYAEDGHATGWITLTQDISERKAAEQALRDSEEQLRTITNNLPVVISRFDRDRRYEFINETAESWYGRPAREVIGKTIAEVFPPDSYEKIKPRIDKVLGGETVRFQDSLATPDGGRREIESVYVPDYDSQGRVRGGFALVHDVSERIASERALRESEAQLRTITDNLPAFIIYVDSDQHYRFANRTAESWYGRPASEIIGRRVEEITTPATYAKLRPRIKAVLEGQDIRFEDVLLYPDNVTRAVDHRWIADCDDSGRTRGWFTLIQDITERKRLEAELLRKERLAAMGQLTGTVAHELRNPLGAVAMSLAVIRRKCLDSGLDLDRALSRATRGIDRSDRIVTELLDFTRAKGLQLVSTALGEWLSDVLDEQEIPEGIELARDFQTAGIKVDVDPERLRRAVINVVDNAFQALAATPGATNENTPRAVTVTTRITEGRFELVFADNGPGIPGDVLPQVTEPLFSTKSFGTGLGLPTVKRIMEDHNGGIEIESEVGQGTRVVLWLPLRGA